MGAKGRNKNRNCPANKPVSAKKKSPFGKLSLLYGNQTRFRLSIDGKHIGTIRLRRIKGNNRAQFNFLKNVDIQRDDSDVDPETMLLDG